MIHAVKKENQHMKTNGTIHVNDGETTSVTVYWSDIDGPIIDSTDGSGLRFKIVGVRTTVYSDDDPYTEAITVVATKSGEPDKRYLRSCPWYYRTAEELDAVLREMGLTVPANVEEAAALLLPKKGE